LRARVDGWAFEDLADQRDTLGRLVEAEERVARLRGAPEWGDLAALRAWLADVARRAAEGGALDGAAAGGQSGSGDGRRRAGRGPRRRQPGPAGQHLLPARVRRALGVPAVRPARPPPS